MIIFVDGFEIELKEDGFAYTVQDFSHDQAEAVGRALLFADRIARRITAK